MPLTWTINGAAKAVPATALCPSPEIFRSFAMGTTAVSVKVALMAELPTSDTVMLTLPAARPEKLASVDVFAALGYVPTPKQAEFHAATEFSVLFGGSAGGGKSRAEAGVAEGGVSPWRAGPFAGQPLASGVIRRR